MASSKRKRAPGERTTLGRKFVSTADEFLSGFESADHTDPPAQEPMSDHPTKDRGGQAEDGGGMPEPLTTPVRFDLLVVLLPELEKRAGVGRLIEAAYESGVVYKNFDWPSWKTDREYLAEPGGLDDADLDTCCKLLTVIVRQDRFVEGSLDGHVASGLAARIVRRIAELTGLAMPDEKKPATKRGKK